MAAPTDGGCSRDCWRLVALMRTYIGITGLVFALMFAAHVARILAEGSGLLREPLIIVTSVLSLGLSIWALVLLTRGPR